MTPQEALEALKIEQIQIEGKAIRVAKFFEGILVANEALKKQIPKKITHEATLYKCCTCPNCKNVVDEFIDFQGAKTRVTSKFCKYCGQALDWSDTE